MLPGPDSHVIVILQHVVLPSHEEQGRHHGFRRHHRRQARLDRVDVRSAVDPVHFHRQRLQARFQNHGAFAVGLYGIVLCGQPRV